MLIFRVFLETVSDPPETDLSGAQASFLPRGTTVQPQGGPDIGLPAPPPARVWLMA